MPTSRQKRAIVIGSGFGGLATAIRLQSMGFATTMLEQHDKPGGRATAWEQDGFHFDAGPTVVTAPHCLEELFSINNRKMSDYVDLIPVDPMYRLFWEDGESFDYTRDHGELLKNIEKMSPGDVEGYSKFTKYAQRVFEKGYLELGHVPFLKLRDMAAVAPDLLKLRAYQSVYSVVSDFMSHPKLRQAFSFNSLLIGGNPFVASAIYTLIHPLEKKWGAWFPKGGMFSLVNALARLFEDEGGILHLSTPVDKITTASQKVTGVQLRNGEQLEADLVVSNADVAFTYTKLLQDEPAVRAKQKAILRKRFSPSLFLIYFGTNKGFPNLLQHNVMFGARYKGLIADIFAGNKLADDFSLYLHAPSKTDPALAPQGCESFYVLSPVPNLRKNAIDWQSEAPRYRDKIINYLEERYMPGLADSIVTEKIFGPEDFGSRLQAHQGSAFSLEPTLTQSAWFRTHNRDSKISGLYFCGAGTHPGAGIPGVVASGKATANVVARDHGLEDYCAESDRFARDLKHATI